MKEETSIEKIDSARDEFIKKRVLRCKHCFGKGTRGYNLTEDRPITCKCYFNAIAAWDRFYATTKGAK